MPENYLNDRDTKPLQKNLCPNPETEGVNVSLNQHGIRFNVLRQNILKKALMPECCTAFKLLHRSVAGGGTNARRTHSRLRTACQLVLLATNTVIPVCCMVWIVWLPDVFKHF